MEESNDEGSEKDIDFADSVINQIAFECETFLSFEPDFLEFHYNESHQFHRKCGGLLYSVLLFIVQSVVVASFFALPKCALRTSTEHLK